MNIYGEPVLTIAVPTFNMEWCLAKNLRTYRDHRLFYRLEVLCVNNASEDSSKEIIESFCSETPEIYRMIDREIDDYGAAINDAISSARGKYFRIVDADDWVNTEDLIKLVDTLEKGGADVVLTDYQMVSMDDQSVKAVRAMERGANYGQVCTTFEGPIQTLPSTHGTTYRLKLLREHHFYVQTGLFFVAEEYVILPYLYARSVIYYPYDIYRYQVANPNQSTSPVNRARYYKHREKVLRRLITEYHAAQRGDVDAYRLDYCYRRIGLGAADHFTTLYLYSADRRRGRMLAREWKTFLRMEAPEFWDFARRKVSVLSLLNVLHLPLPLYERIKTLLLSNRISDQFMQRYRTRACGEHT